MVRFVRSLCDTKVKIHTFCFCTFFILLISCSSVKGKSMEVDTYIGMTLAQLVELLGEPVFVDYKDIDNNYFRTPVEPPYSSFFSNEELEKGVKVALAKWICDKGKTEILAWLKIKDEDLVVFTSRRYQAKKNSRIRIYL